MKKSILFLLLLFSLPSLAQKDAKAKELLEKSSEAFSTAGGIEASFTLNIKDVLNAFSEVFDGRILLKGNKFFIETPEYALFFDGKTQWTYNKAFDEVNITEPSEKEVQALNPASIYKMYQKGSNYKYLGEKTDTKMRKVQEVELTSKNKKEDIQKVILQMDKTNFMPLMFHLFLMNDMENIVYINNYKTNQTIPDEAFSFDASQHPDVEIIDLR